MTTYLYLSLIPEALIASMLPPDDFGLYYAIGSAKRSHGQAIFFSVDRSKLGDADLPLEDADARCVAHADGSPKRSLYLSIYRALERVPREALTALHLATDDGRVLTVEPQEFIEDGEDRTHLYQELCPVTPRIVSALNPAEFAEFLTGAQSNVHVPRIVFAELTLGNLKNDPDHQDVDNLPYPNIGHLRDCLRELAAAPDKATKTVLRQMTQEVLFRTIRNGVFVGDPTGITSFPLPSQDALEREHRAWWRSAQSTFGQ
ncbi:hypothetical protein [Demequina sp.]|uniref:hypothetical protein n=1 Tax=Demequina sp. TaxID=2050685 RepID=UPI0025C67659|nr:hypothetical protein [Demequina sp.]